MVKNITEFKKELSTHIRARYPVIAIPTYEEGRVIQLIRDIADKENRTVFVWSAASGFKNSAGRILNENWQLANTNEKARASEDEPIPIDPIVSLELIRKKVVDDVNGQDDKGKSISTQGNIFVMLDVHGFMGGNPGTCGYNPMVQRKLRDLIPDLKGQRKIIVFVSPQFDIPQDLQKSITLIDLPLPDKAEIEGILCRAVNGLSEQETRLKDEIKTQPDIAESKKPVLAKLQQKKRKTTEQVAQSKDAIISAAAGLTLEEAENVIAKCMIQGDLNISTILGENKQIIKKSGQLEYIEPKETVDSIGGLRNLKKYMTSAGRRFSKAAHEFGIDPPRGIILVGVPGAGKSLSAKACGNVLGLPLVRLDMAQLVSKYYGESSNNMRTVWKIVNSLAPCILWVDEIEKALGAGNNGEMHEESARLFGSFLTEMEESSGVFVIATCNDHMSLKAELLSRFQKIFFVNAPSHAEREEIFAIHLKTVNRDPKDFDLKLLAESSIGFVGREIRNVVQDALGEAFDEGDHTKLTNSHVLNVMKTVTPITKQKAVVLRKMIQWAGDNAIPASDDVSDLPNYPDIPGKSTVNKPGPVTQDRSEILDYVGNDEKDPLDGL